MTVEELPVQAPRTRNCRACSVEINAASARCPYCGARQFKHQPILGWRGLLICLVVAAAAVLVTRAVVESSNPDVQFQFYRSPDLSLLVPASYQDEFLTAPHDTAIAGFSDPAHPADTEVVQATTPDRGTPRSRILALNATLRNEVGVARGYIGPVVFPGGQGAWEILYTLDRVAYAVFSFDSCGGAIAVTVTLSNSSERTLASQQQALPQAAGPICNGPAFSRRDRADAAVPLR